MSRLFGGEGYDRIYGGVGKISFRSGIADSGKSLFYDSHYKSMHTHVISPGKDLIIGGKGRDTLFGGKGIDTIRGQAGKDLLKGRQLLIEV